jgi:hypothetical protein
MIIVTNAIAKTFIVGINITCIINSNCKVTAIIFALKIWLVSRYIIVNIIGGT